MSRRSRVFPSTRVGLRCGSVTGDGSLDLVLGSGAVYLNNGAGAFTIAVGAGVVFDSHPVAIMVAELTGDAHLDLIRLQASGGACFDTVAGNSVTCGTVVKLYVGAGDGSFTPQSSMSTGALHSLQSSLWQNADETVSKQVSLGDLDGDGDLDFFTGAQIAVNQNDGSWAVGSSYNGVYLVADSNAPDLAGQKQTSSLLADFDGDGMERLNGIADIACTCYCCCSRADAASLPLTA